MENTIVILSSHHRPVLDDGCEDDAVTKNGDQTSANPHSWAKYSKLMGGTRVPMIISWRGKIAPGVFDAATSQADFLASFATLAEANED